MSNKLSHTINPAAAFGDVTLEQLAAAINVKTGVKMERASTKAEREQSRREEQAKREAQAHREGCEDDETCGEIRSAIGEGNAKGALEYTRRIHNAELRACYLRGVTYRFKLVDCPCCGGACHAEAMPGNEECAVCDGLGLVEQHEAERFEDDLATYQNTQAA